MDVRTGAVVLATPTSDMTYLSDKIQAGAAPMNAYAGAIIAYNTSSPTRDPFYLCGSRTDASYPFGWYDLTKLTYEQ